MSRRALRTLEHSSVLAVDDAFALRPPQARSNRSCRHPLHPAGVGTGRHELQHDLAESAPDLSGHAIGEFEAESDGAALGDWLVSTLCRRGKHDEARVSRSDFVRVLVLPAEEGDEELRMSPAMDERWVAPVEVVLDRLDPTATQHHRPLHPPARSEVLNRRYRTRGGAQVGPHPDIAVTLDALIRRDPTRLRDAPGHQGGNVNAAPLAVESPPVVSTGDSLSRHPAER